jgi:disulfide bond formation protein DsbB
MKDQAADLAVKASVPAGVSGLTVLGVSLPDWVLLLTALYTVLALWALIRDKYIARWKERRDAKDRNH